MALLIKMSGNLDGTWIKMMAPGSKLASTSLIFHWCLPMAVGWALDPQKGSTGTRWSSFGPCKKQK